MTSYMRETLRQHCALTIRNQEITFTFGLQLRVLASIICSKGKQIKEMRDYKKKKKNEKEEVQEKKEKQT